MRGAFGKPNGLVARVNIGQILMSVRTRDSNRAVALEALRRCQYKVCLRSLCKFRVPKANYLQFPGRQKIIVSKNWGFTPLKRDEYVQQRQEGKVKIDGAYVQFLRNKGNLAENIRRFPTAFEASA